MPWPSKQRCGSYLVLGLCLLTPRGVMAEVWGVAQARYGLNTQVMAQGCSSSPCVRLDGDHLLSVGTRVPGERGIYVATDLTYRFSALDPTPRRAVDTYGVYGDLRVLRLQAGYQDPARRMELRLGRQGLWDADPITFDGLSLTWAPSEKNPRLRLRAWGGQYTDLAADGWAQRLYGSLFPQAAEGISPPVGLLVGGASIIVPLKSRATLELSDTLIQGQHLGRMEITQPWDALSISAGIRTLDATLRDAWATVHHIDLSRAQILAITLTRAGDQPFALGPTDGIATLVDQLRIGDRRAHWRLDGLIQRPLGPFTVDAIASVHRMVNRELQEGFQRDTLYAQLGLSWVHDELTLSSRAHGLIQPGVGSFGGPTLPLGREGEPALFADLSGEGIGALTGVSCGAQRGLGSTLSAGINGDLLVIHQYSTQILDVEFWEAFALRSSLRWRPRPSTTLNAQVGIEQDLHAVFGLTTLHRRGSLALTYRW